MSGFVTDETGALWIQDEQGDAWPVLQDEDGYYVEGDGGDAFELDAGLVEAALSEDDQGLDPQEAWNQWADIQLRQLDKQLGRRLTENEVSKIYDRASNHNEPTPDFGKLFDEEFPGRRNNRDEDTRQTTMREIMDDADREQEQEEDDARELVGHTAPDNAGQEAVNDREEN